MPPRAGLRRALVGIADQGVYSLSNFALTVIVARQVSPTEFGTYALVLATYLIGIATARGLTSETYVVKYSADPDVGSRAGNAAMGFSVWLGIALGAVLTVVGIVDGGQFLWVGLSFGLSLPGLIAQDFVRYAALARKRASEALVTDITQAVVQFGVSAAVIATHRDSVAWFVAAWGLGGYVGLLVACIRLRIHPRMLAAKAWFTGHRELAVRYAADDFTNQAGQQANAYVVALVNGLAETGALRAAQSVFGPPSILNLGIMTAVTPELVRLGHRSPRRMRKAAFAVGIGSALIGAVWGVLAVLCPDDIGRELFGRTWPLAEPLLGFFLISQTANGLRTAPMAGLRALADPRRTLRARWIATVITISATLTGAIVEGARGVAIALAVVTWLQVAIWGWQFHGAYRDRLARGGPLEPAPVAAPAGGGGGRHRASGPDR